MQLKTFLLLAGGFSVLAFSAGYFEKALGSSGRGKKYIDRNFTEPQWGGIAKRQDLGNSIDSVFQNWYKCGQFNGAIGILLHDTLIYQNAFGFLNNKFKERLSGTSSFQIASVSKIFTALAFAKLMEEKNIDIAAKVNTFLPGFPYPKVSVGNLLMHNSGLPNYIYFSGQYTKNDSLPFNNDRIVEIMTTYRPREYFQPGRRFMYSNTNYVLLASIIEKISGEKFQDYVRKNIFEPVGLKNTFFYHPLDTLRGQTSAFDMRRRAIGNDRLDLVFGDKGIYSSAQDMMLFSKALFSGKIIKNPGILTKARIHTHLGHYYGFGFRINPNAGDTIVFHNGWWHGYRAAFHYRKSDGATVILLSNHLDRYTYQTPLIFNIIDRKRHGEADHDEKLAEGEF